MPGQHRPELSVTQLISGAGATVTATVAASYFGVGGTLAGAAAMSVLSTAGATLYQHFLDRGKQRIVARIPARVGAGGAGEEDTAPAEASPRRPWPKWYVLAGAATAVFLVVMGMVTGFELLTGRPLSNTVHGGQGRGTTVLPVRGPVRAVPRGPATSQVSAPAATTPSARATAEPTPSTTPTPSATAGVRPLPTERSAPAQQSGAPAPVRSTEQQRQPPLDEQPLQTP